MSMSASGTIMAVERLSRPVAEIEKPPALSLGIIALCEVVA